MTRWWRANLSRTATVLALLTLAAGACIQVFQVVLFGKLPDHFDFWLQEYVHLEVLHRALRGGEIPLWNPYLITGTPHLADPQSAVLYPLTTLPLLVLPAALVARLSIPTHIFLAATGTYFLARSYSTSRVAAVAAGFVFSLAPHFAPIELPTYLEQSAAWVPWVLLALRLALQRRAAGWFALAGALWALQLLRGYAQTWYFTGLLLGWFALAYLVAEVWPARGSSAVRRVLPLLAGLALSGIVALGLSAAQLVPSLDLLGVSHRAGSFSLAEATGRGRITLFNLLGAAGPDAEVSGAFPGGVALGLALAAILFGRLPGLRFWSITAATGLALCLGSAVPVWRALYATLPGFGLWHMPHRALFIWSLSLAMLAAYGLDALRTRTATRPLMACAGGLSAVIWLAAYAGSDVPDEARLGAVHLIAGLAIVVALAWLRPRWKHAVVVLALAVPLDLLAHTLPRLYGRFYPPDAVYAAPEAARWLVDHADSAAGVRFASATYGKLTNQLGDPKVQDNRRLAYLPPNSSALYSGLDAAQGYLAIRLQRSGALFGAINDLGTNPRSLSIIDPSSRLLDVIGVRYFVTDDVAFFPPRSRSGASLPSSSQPGQLQIPLSARFSLAYHGEGVRIWENRRAQPFAWWVPSYSLVEDDGAALEALANGTVDPTSDALLTARIPELAPNSSTRLAFPAVSEVPASSPGQVNGSRVVVTRRTSNTLSLDVSAPAAGLVVVGQTTAPGWQARVDGNPATVYEANGAQQAVYVPAGARRVELWYLPLSVALGATLSTVVALSLGGWALWIALGRRRSSARARGELPDPSLGASPLPPAD
jgi:hypothetical protein